MSAAMGQRARPVLVAHFTRAAKPLIADPTYLIVSSTLETSEPRAVPHTSRCRHEGVRGASSPGHTPSQDQFYFRFRRDFAAKLGEDHPARNNRIKMRNFLNQCCVLKATS